MIRLERPPCPNTRALRTNYKHPENKDALRKACSDKCMYCESRITATYFGDVEHIRPKDRFAHLEFVWENLGFVCAKCNNAKSNKWDDSTPFLNPFEEAPEEHLAACGPFIYHFDGSERGEYTWREIDLNRPELVSERKERIDALRILIDKLKRTKNAAIRVAIQEELARELSNASVYSLVVKAAAVQLLARG